MEVHLRSETEQRLKRLSEQSGRGTDELVEDAMTAYLDEVAQLREALDSRYDDLKNCKVESIPTDAVEAHFQEKSATRRSRPGS